MVTDWIGLCVETQLTEDTFCSLTFKGEEGDLESRKITDWLETLPWKDELEAFLVDVTLLGEREFLTEG